MRHNYYFFEVSNKENSNYIVLPTELIWTNEAIATASKTLYTLEKAQQVAKSRSKQYNCNFMIFKATQEVSTKTTFTNI